MVDNNSRRNSINNDDFDIPNDNVIFSQGDLARARLASIIAAEQFYQEAAPQQQ
jgi:hypothetical protein